jgi:Glycosyltransferase
MRAADGRPLRVAMIGTRGVPAAYGGFETAVEEIGRRMAADGAEITVYCRTKKGAERPSAYEGMRLVHLPALRSKTLETLSHTGLSVLHAVLRRRYDAAFVFNAANSPFLPVLRIARIPVAVHVDGLEWKRGKWGRVGRKYYRVAESLAVRWADALIADAQGIADYYEREFGVDTTLLTYGAKAIDAAPDSGSWTWGWNPAHITSSSPGSSRRTTSTSSSTAIGAARPGSPLVVVGSAPYAAEHSRRIAELAEGDERIRMLGGVWDQELLDQLYANALTYLHGHSVGGTNPSLLRAMGAATAVVAYDVDFNREVAGPDARYFGDPDAVRECVEAAEIDPGSTKSAGSRLQERALERYDWDLVARGYTDLAVHLQEGHSSAGARSRKRSSPVVAEVFSETTSA